MIGQPATPAPNTMDEYNASPQQAPNTMPLKTPPPEQMAQNNAMMSTMNRGARTPGGMRT